MRITTTMLPLLSAQDVFDIVATAMLRQNARATADGVKCMYRAPDGKRCAIGWLVPDEVYEKSLEFFGVRDIAVRLATESGDAGRFARFLYIHMPLLRDLQGMHDANLPAEWPQTLREIAYAFRLHADVVDVHARLKPVPVVKPTRRQIMRLVAPTYLFDLKKLKPVSKGVDYGCAEREVTCES
ncbi:hypothetical protein G3N95_24040 [Paraburkholderia sp. Tr-20389]|uniref:hypothetical protein n=1 Tax=Paraburkholderia sp. Tr-20389 TaxID=2703903 RepID=UPI00197E958D|nr:hypothetical protein [Paraburkholderia sp. Tr-20389]MBN3756034.1 hypothetical protein [Paraburkholderia sp. Tr-20389]